MNKRVNKLDLIILLLNIFICMGYWYAVFFVSNKEYITSNIFFALSWTLISVLHWINLLNF